MRKTIAAVALSTAGFATLATPAAAHAELYGVDDIRDTYHGSDILALSVRNAHDTISIKTYHEGLHRNPATGSAGTIFIDTDRTDRGPEYVFSGAYYEGSDYLLRHTDGFRPSTWGDPVENGDYVMRVNYRRSTAKVLISRAALGGADSVRVAVRASGTRTDGTSHGLVDWVGKWRQFTPWIQRGWPHPGR